MIIVLILSMDKDHRKAEGRVNSHTELPDRATTMSAAVSAVIMSSVMYATETYRYVGEVFASAVEESFWTSARLSAPV